MPGYVYILSNPSMPGLVKVGSTSGHPVKRAKQLSSWTGVPEKFIVECFWSYETSEEAIEYELVLHEQLEKRMPGREFFRTTPAKAMMAFPKILGNPDYVSDSVLLEIGEMDEAIDRFCMEIDMGMRV